LYTSIAQLSLFTD